MCVRCVSGFGEGGLLVVSVWAPWVGIHGEGGRDGLGVYVRSDETRLAGV